MAVLNTSNRAGASGQGTGGGGGGGEFYSYQIENSCRFESANTTKLSKSFGSSSNLAKFTLSVWAKRTLTYANGGNTNWQTIICEDSGPNGGGAAFGFESGGGTSGGLDNRDRIIWYGLKGSSGGSTGGDDRIEGYYRDTTSWYHIVVTFDTTQSSGNKVKYYVNGDGPKTRTTTNEPSGNSNNFNTNGQTHVIGSTTSNNYGFDGYLAEFIFSDGYAYGPDQFGETKNGVWIPKDPSGTTFGSNGFHLKFASSGQGIFPSSLTIGGSSADSTSTGSINLFSNIGAANPPANRTQTGQSSLSYTVDLGSAKTIGAWLGQGHQSSGYATRTATGTVSYSDNNSDFTSVGSSTYTFGNGVAANGHTFTPSSHRYWKLSFPSASGGDGSSGYQIGGFFLGALQSTAITDLGADSSGNGNNFTASNLGADHQVKDSPTFGS